jgi:hypothetical protein
MFLGLSLHSVKQRVDFNTLVLVFKMKNRMVPNDMQDEMLLNVTRRFPAAAVLEDEHANYDLA